jgi:hypothetical protein
MRVRPSGQHGQRAAWAQAPVGSRDRNTDPGPAAAFWPRGVVVPGSDSTIAAPLAGSRSRYRHDRGASQPDVQLVVVQRGNSNVATIRQQATRVAVERVAPAAARRLDADDLARADRLAVAQPGQHALDTASACRAKQQRTDRPPAHGQRSRAGRRSRRATPACDAPPGSFGAVQTALRAATTSRGSRSESTLAIERQGAPTCPIPK